MKATTSTREENAGEGWQGLGQLEPVAMTAAGAAVGALFLVALTLGLLLQVPAPGQETGAHLKVLGGYLPGYDVTWPGAAAGAFYGGVLGAAMGYVVAFIWNFSHLLIIRWWLFQRLISRV